MLPWTFYIQHFFYLWTVKINRLSVLGMHAIGRGQSAAEKLFSIMGLFSPVNHSTWAEHTKLLLRKMPKSWLKKNLAKLHWRYKKAFKKIKTNPMQFFTQGKPRYREEYSGVSANVHGIWRCSYCWSCAFFTLLFRNGLCNTKGNEFHIRYNYKVQKRLPNQGKTLTNLIFCTGKKLSDGKGLCGAGRLTLKITDTIQNLHPCYI